jgi:non-ribosomal peptide synthetase component F
VTHPTFALTKLVCVIRLCIIPQTRESVPSAWAVPDDSAALDTAPFATSKAAAAQNAVDETHTSGIVGKLQGGAACIYSGPCVCTLVSLHASKLL